MNEMLIGEKLPLPLFAAWFESCVFDGGEQDMAMKEGFERCADIVLPLLAQCVPCVEAMARDTRITQADSKLLMLLAKLQELTNVPPRTDIDDNSPCLETMG